MICFESDGFVFNFRVAGILFHDGRVLVHRSLRDDYYAFPGGRVEPGEDTATTVIREFQEEIGLTVEVVRLLWVNENFFTHEGKSFHELGFYYLLKAREEATIPTGDLFHSIELGEDGRPTLEFRWVETEKAAGMELFPVFAKTRLGELPTVLEHVVEREIPVSG